MPIGGGFNKATANLYLNVQLARGIRVAMSTYFSTRHHSEAWVKDGYFLIDASPIEHPFLDFLMARRHAQGRPLRSQLRRPHFRRSDGGRTTRTRSSATSFIDAFTTEIGGEGYLRLSARSSPWSELPAARFAVR